jgi:hypothetical protein
MSQSGNTLLPRAICRINPKLEQKLGMYLAAAGAAGVSLTALANKAQAKVVYTPANISIPFDTAQPIDLNGDGIADVTLQVTPGDKSFDMWANLPGANAVRLTGPGGDVAAGFFGVPIGPGEKFAGGTYQPMYGKVFGYGNASSYAAFGPWANVSNRYLGLQFYISGTVHYGWVRITTSSTADPLITGWAYETTPHTSIKGGTISGPVQVGYLQSPEVRFAASQPASLGLLASGWRGIAIWRREESELAPNATPAL